MKKTSILVLIMVFVLSLCVSAFGCATKTPSTSESSSESEIESILESETTSDLESETTSDLESETTSDLESETTSELESESDSAPVEEVLDSAVYEQIVTANAGEAVLTSFNTYQVSYYFEDGALGGHSASYYYYRAEDAHCAYYKLVDGQDQIVSEINVIDGLKYSLDMDGEYTFAIFPEVDKNLQVFNFGFIDFSAFGLDGDVLALNGEISFTVKAVEKDTQIATVFDFVVDEQTLLFKSAERRIEDADGAYLEVAQISFGYDVEADVSTAVVEHISTFEENEGISFVLILNPEGDAVKTSYTVAENVNIVMDNDSQDNTYTFYKNYFCTKDIEDLDEILVDYNGATVYATQTKAQFSFDFTLTEADVEQMNGFIAKFFELVETSSDFDEIDEQRAMVEDKMGYFVHQYYMGQIQYYMDISKQAGKDAFNFAQETYNDMYDAYITMYRDLYEMSDNEYSIWMFEDWTEEDLSILYQDNETISALETANTQLEQQFNELANDADWSHNVEVLYEQLVANNQQLATLHGYDNAYDYMAAESYHRNYSDEERASLLANAKKYVYLFYTQAMDKWEAVNAGIDTDLYKRYNLVSASSTKSLKNEYISGYINSYNNSLNQKMKNMYEKKAAKFALVAKSMGTAYVNYSSYYEEGFAFFGREYQDLLTVIHEMGHYVANSAYSLGDMGYDLAETHSQSNEWMMLYYLKDKIDVDVHEVMYSLRLANSMYIVLYGIIVDEFEYRVYNAETPYVAGEYQAVLEGVLDDLGVGAGKVDEFYSYVQQVTLTSPVYYLNYATSELTSIGFYTMAEEEGYEVAQEAYRKLQEDCDLSLSYAQIIASLGLRGPFEEATYKAIQKVFFTED